MPLPFCLTSCSGRASGWRRYEPSELLPIVECEARRLGATRPSDLSGLDSLKTPCWQVVRPEALDIPGNVTTLTGKGWTRDQALLGAYMEFLERHWAENSSIAIEIAKPSQLERHVPLSVMPLPAHIADPGDVPLAWVRGQTLEGNLIWVPAHEVLCPFQPPQGSFNPAIWRSTGLASGAHITEAVFHGLVEVIERDAFAVAEFGEACTSVDLTSTGSVWISTLLERLWHQGIRLEVKQLPATGGIYAFAAFLEDSVSGNPLRLNGGHSAHPDPLLAIESAVLEAVQTRAVFIAGSREDLGQFEGFAALGYQTARDKLARWLDPTTDTVPGPARYLPRPDDLAEVVHTIAQTLCTKGFWPIIFIPLSPPYAAVAVVRVIVPTCSEISPPNLRLGRRVLIPGGQGSAGS
jgi:YcaO-like protein with predicted kinase domain